MRFDKDRRNEVVNILARVRNKEIAQEEADRLLVSYSDELVEGVRSTMTEGWKPKVKVINQVQPHRSTWGEMSKHAQAVLFTAPFLGAYVIFAACLHLIAYNADWQPPASVQWLSSPLLARWVIGALGCIAGICTIRLWSWATLVSALWLAGMGYLFSLWATPLLLAAAVFCVFALQVTLKNEHRHSMLTISGTALMGLSGSLPVMIFGGGAGEERIKDVLTKSGGLPPTAVWILAGVVLVIGIILVIAGVKKGS